MEDGEERSLHFRMQRREATAEAMSVVVAGGDSMRGEDYIQLS